MLLFFRMGAALIMFCIYVLFTFSFIFLSLVLLFLLDLFFLLCLALLLMMTIILSISLFLHEILDKKVNPGVICMAAAPHDNGVVNALIVAVCESLYALPAVTMHSHLRVGGGVETVHLHHCSFVGSCEGDDPRRIIPLTMVAAPPEPCEDGDHITELGIDMLVALLLGLRRSHELWEAWEVSVLGWRTVPSIRWYIWLRKSNYVRMLDAECRMLGRRKRCTRMKARHLLISYTSSPLNVQTSFIIYLFYYRYLFLYFNFFYLIPQNLSSVSLLG
ncbi:hypothetical protein HPP92_021619 [Vanilla planifolia]|uniref:Uncharacterized protein n=1 Tax=Vanilla planifolia TaxID=51239 RepID=A0A835Q4L8_VANPL|nr:hypothetical protein HPP92_021619 [Vanilla planifolia]